MSVTLSVLEELLTHREGAFLVDGVADEASEADARFISAGLHAVGAARLLLSPGVSLTPSRRDARAQATLLLIACVGLAHLTCKLRLAPCAAFAAFAIAFMAPEAVS